MYQASLFFSLTIERSFYYFLLPRDGFETFAQLTWLFIFLINVTSNIL